MIIALVSFHFLMVFIFLSNFSIYSNAISNFGFSLATALIGMVFLFYCKWIQYPINKTLKLNKYIFGCLYAPIFVAIAFPVFLNAEGDYNFLPLIASVVLLFLPERVRSGELFWKYRGKNFKCFPDSGELSSSDINIIINEYNKAVWGLTFGFLLIFIIQGGALLSFFE